MRQLYLVNEVGTSYYFDHRSKTYIEALDGLGFEFDIKYQEFDARFVESKRSIPQRQISVDLVFEDGYVGFTRWREFITKSKQLRLFYSCDGVKYCYVNIRTSTKTQLESGILRTSVQIDCLSLWLVNKSATIDVVETGGGKIYEYTYPYVYSVSFNGTVTVTNASSRSVPLKLTIVGNVMNPRIIVRQNGEDIASCRLFIDERESPTIVINAEPTDQHVVKIVGSDEIDIYSTQDFSLDTFLFLPPGTSEIFFDPGVREPCTCYIEFKEEYIAH